MDNGIVTVASNFSVKETIDRLVATIGPLGLKVFARMQPARRKQASSCTRQSFSSSAIQRAARR
jgi:hypothetical protein